MAVSEPSRWTLSFVSGAEDDLSSLDRLNRRRVIKKLDRLVEYFDVLSHEALGETFRGFFKIRVGDLRIFYRTDYPHRKITVYYIGRRDKAYKT